ncbi:hypothetical protein H9Y04_19925 [Streptomyces sp. TRM66268-LWL]|uniref:Uncharacterized protein n=1 Tax=Streptomyces polyasparticus TaxID=2767826 RepID=A0ABR7SIN3_9ACTN|nr:hypothetical protein [Streptomyces polyasparticus]MBC9714824.1 hypothetical protein [Streptomyces polyasparticus]
MRSGRLQEEAFVNHAYAKLGYQGGVPQRYRDESLPAQQETILAMALGRELGKLPHPVRRSVQNRLGGADELAPIIARDPEEQRPAAGDLNAALQGAAPECGPKWDSGQRCTYNTANFSLIYFLGGENDTNPYDGAGNSAVGDVPGNGVPNYVDRMGRSFEYAYAAYAGLGYEPRDDHDKRVAVFIGSEHAPPGTGAVQPYEVADANVIHMGSKWSAGQEADEFYLPRHELFHSMQYKHIGASLLFNLKSLNSWMEATAEWGAHQAMKDDPHMPSAQSDDYAKSLDLFFQRPDEALTAWDGWGEGRQYGAFIFAEFMEERFGAESIRKSWERISDAWFPDGQTEIRDMLKDEYGADLHEEIRAFGVANYQMCGTGSASDSGTWHYKDPDVSDWCQALSGTGSDGTFAVARPAHDTVTLAQDTGQASGDATVEYGGVHYVDLIGSTKPSDLWNMDVRTTQDEDKRLSFTVVNWETIPRRCFAPDRTARGQDETVSTRIGGKCHVVTLMISHGEFDEDEEKGHWETRYTTRFGGVVGNSGIEIGVQPGGNLITPGSPPSAGTKTTDLGLRHKATNMEGVSAVGCLCEGWGIEVTPPGGVGQWSGWAHGLKGLSPNAEVTQFVATDHHVVSKVRLTGTDYPVTVTHEFRPSSRSSLYDVKVTITSEAPPADTPHITYRRVVDWDVEPTPVNEYVTVKADHELVEYSSDHGRGDPDPASGRTKYLKEGSFTDEGPYDGGALLDVNVPMEPVTGTPGVGVQGQFDLFYGAADNAEKAKEALSAVGAPVYSLAKPSTPGNPGSGEPVTFILGYKPGT